MEKLILVFFVVMSILGIYNFVKDSDEKITIPLVIYTLVSTLFFTAMSLGIIFSENKNIYKVDLPEEIIIAKEGDTLIVNKITEDSIYLGYNKFKK